MFSDLTAFLPETVLLLGSLALFGHSLGQGRLRAALVAVRVTAGLAVVAALASLDRQAVLFDGAYRVDAFSQWLKLALAGGFATLVWLRDAPVDIREDIRPEFLLFQTLSVTGLMLLVSAIEVITLVVALEISAFPLYLLVPMRREQTAQRSQMESAIKYIMFGVAANGIMLFGLSYLYGLTGTTMLPDMLAKLEPAGLSPLALAGLGLTFAGFYFKLAVFPFHFWTPDVYEGASHETAGLIASLPKLGALAVFLRFVSLAPPESQVIAQLLAGLAIASLFYGNLVALVQSDFKRLLGFSGIAHAGYALVGLVALDAAGFTAALYYMVGYVFMVLTCFAVICQVSRAGENVKLEDLTGLHRRSPLLALTLLVGVFALAGVPPFVGFMGKLALLKAAFARGHSVLVVLVVLNTAIAIYYYLGVIREAYFRDRDELPRLPLSTATRALCVGLIAVNVGLAVVPGRLLQTISSSLSGLHVVAFPEPTVAGRARHSVRAAAGCNVDCIRGAQGTARPTVAQRFMVFMRDNCFAINTFPEPSDCPQSRDREGAVAGAGSGVGPGAACSRARL
jgi:NADH-quinone oxidoreductase subunit N